MPRSPSPASSCCTVSGRDSSDWDVWAFRVKPRLRSGMPCLGLEFSMAQTGRFLLVTAICTRAINSGIARVDPPDRCTIMGLHRKGQALAAQPKPDPTHRTEFGKAREDSADRRGHRRIGVKAYFAVFLAPDEAHR